MAEGKDYEAVLTEEDDQNKVPFEGAEEESKEATGRSPEENIELKGAHEGDDADDDDYDESHHAAFRRIVARRSFLGTVEEETYEKVKEEVTARALMNYGEDTLWLAIKVSEKLRLRDITKGKADKDNFNALAEQVEEFTLRFLDPLKDLPSDDSQVAALKPELDLILETGTKLRVKKFFEHPVVDSILNERWHTVWGSYWKKHRPWRWFFLKMWCLLDVVLFPLTFSTNLVLGRLRRQQTESESEPVGRLRRQQTESESEPVGRLRRQQTESDSEPVGFKQLYDQYLTIPYFVFIRDTISYLAFLALHFAICLQPSQLPLSDLEWAILVFYIGRLLGEGKQIKEAARSKSMDVSTAYFNHFLNDHWNTFDFYILALYFFGILPLRIDTWRSSESPSNNQNLESAGYLYAVNTMLLTFRVFGSFLEVSERFGTIQIALFQVMNDTFVVAVHFVVITVAFSSAITKVLRASPGIQLDTKKYSWLGITSQLGLSLLELSDGLDYFRSADSSSETFAHWLFALYLVMTLILLVNLLIALLSNTYQKVQDNSRREWTFKRAVRIQTYSYHDPVPVPFNIISMFLMLFPCFRKKKNEESDTAMGVKKVTFTDWPTGRQEYVIKGKRLGGLLSLYRQRYGNSFPVTETLHQMVKETKNTVNQILEKAFTSDKALLPTGPKAWEAHNSILVESCLLTCQSSEPVKSEKEYISCLGARYRSNFSPRFPHFEMMILESVDTSSLSFGVVPESWDCKDTPGQKGTVGFHTDLKIFDFDYEPMSFRWEEKEVAGVDRIRRGDIIRCTVMFEHEEERDGKVHVPVSFTVNGTRIQRQGLDDSPSPQRFIKSKPDDPLYPFIGFSYKSSVLAKMCARDDVDHYQDLQLQEVKSELTEAKGELSEVKLQLNDVKVQLREATSKLEEKLDALLTKASEKQNE